MSKQINPNLIRMKLDELFIEEISQFEMIYCHLSGGIHTTAAAYLLKDYGFKNVSLVHNLTYLEYPECLDVMQKIIYDTDYSYNIIPPNLKGRRMSEIMRESFLAIPRIKKLVLSIEEKIINEYYEDLLLDISKLKKELKIVDSIPKER